MGVVGGLTCQIGHSHIRKRTSRRLVQCVLKGRTAQLDPCSLKFSKNTNNDTKANTTYISLQLAVDGNDS